MTTGMNISSGVEKLQKTLDGAIEGVKIAHLRRDTKDYHDPRNRVTTDYGVKQNNTDMHSILILLSDDWLKVATEDETGPMLMEDHAAREKNHGFDHERIPERVVHTRGSGAFGTFKLHKSLEQYTSAGVLTDTTRSTPTFLCFSTVLGSAGSADTHRDVRGFAIEHYNPEGNRDVVGDNIPVFLIQDTLKFPDARHAGKSEPHNGVP